MAGRLKYRDPTDGWRWAEWVRELRDRSGAYVIRDRASRKVLYVGESHTDQLYKTLTRHFQAWSLPGESGKTYSRSRCEVAVVLVSSSERRKAIAEQDALIERLKPRDNVRLTNIGEDFDPGEYEDDFANDFM